MQAEGSIARKTMEHRIIENLIFMASANAEGISLPARPEGALHVDLEKVQFLNEAKTNCINLFVKPCTKHQEKIEEDEGQKNSYMSHKDQAQLDTDGLQHLFGEEHPPEFSPNLMKSGLSQ